MKQLHRPDPPEGLDQYNYRSQRWDDLSSTDKRAIRGQLVAMQGTFCAYCECRLPGDVPNQNGNVKQHIEHFRQKGKDPRVTFQWENLFLSCWEPHCCGRHKDSLASVDYDLLLKPDECRPELHLLFTLSGDVCPRSQDPESRSSKRAEETIKVFGLGGDKNPLRYQRQNAIASAQCFMKEILEWSEILEEGDEELQDDIQQLLAEELEQLKNYLYYTAIKHSLLPEQWHLEFDSIGES